MKIEKLKEPVYNFEPHYPYSFDEEWLQYRVLFYEDPILTFSKFTPRSEVVKFVNMLNGVFNYGRMYEKMNQG